MDDETTYLRSGKASSLFQKIKQIDKKVILGNLCNIFCTLFAIAFLITIGVLAIVYRESGPTITLKRLSQSPIISFNNSVFDFNYNSAYLPVFIQGETDSMHGLAVRVQNYNKSKGIYDALPSEIAIVVSKDGMNFPDVKETDVVITTNEPFQEKGAEDARIVFYKGTYYMFYTAVKPSEKGRGSDLGKVEAQLALATCSDVYNINSASCWKLRGPIVKNVEWSKSGALLTREGQEHLLFWGDDKIRFCTSKNLIDYDCKDENVLIEPRSGMFDSELVESGPPPVRLSNGNYLFLYNSARKVENLESPRPDHKMQYNIGYLILDKDDPRRVLFRSDKPILSPELDWETCSKDTKALMPHVVFVEGMRKTGNDKFVIYYAGCDTYMGAAEITITF
jgi:predicted GH43/DUF377 family glycosyl hydrolase